MQKWLQQCLVQVGLERWSSQAPRVLHETLCTLAAQEKRCQQAHYTSVWGSGCCSLFSWGFLPCSPFLQRDLSLSLPLILCPCDASPALSCKKGEDDSEFKQEPSITRTPFYKIIGKEVSRFPREFAIFPQGQRERSYFFLLNQNMLQHGMGLSSFQKDVLSL